MRKNRAKQQSVGPLEADSHYTEIVVARAIGGNIDEKSIPWIFVRSETPYRTAGRSSYGRRTPLHGSCRRWTKYGIGAAADSEGAGRQPDDPSKSCAGKAAVLGPAFVGTPRRSLRDVPSSPKRLCGGPRPVARRDGHRPGQQAAASARQFDSDRQTQ